jgi:hypothetical protein
MEPYAIVFTNSTSSLTFSLNYNGASLGHGFNQLSQVPGPTLAPGGQQTMSLGEAMGPVGDSQFYMTWYEPTSGLRLGVLLHIPVQVGGIGARPYWYVSLDNTSDPTQAPNWVPSGDEPSDPYTWRDLPPNTFQASATTDSSHEGLIITVTLGNQVN